MGQVNGCNRGVKEDEETQLFGNYGQPNPPDLSAMFGSSSKKEVTKPHPAELVDQASRGLFPLGFTLFNLAYWFYYLYFTDEDLAALQDNVQVHDL